MLPPPSHLHGYVATPITPSRLHCCPHRTFTATSPPPSHLHSYIAAPIAPSQLRRRPHHSYIAAPSSHMGYSTACLTAAWPCRPPPPFQPRSPRHCAPSCTATALPPSQPHMSLPLCHPHRPHCSTPHSWTHYTTAPITAAHTTLLHTLPLHGPCHPLHSRTASLRASQLGGLHHPLPLSYASHVTACLTAGWATLPPSLQLGTPHHCMPHSWTGHVATSLTIAHATSLCAS